MLAEQGVAASQAGAAVLHVHARDPRDGRPTPDPAAYMAFLPRLKAGCEAIINVTTGGSLNMTVDDRLKAPVMLRPEDALAWLDHDRETACALALPFADADMRIIETA